ncbi:MAG: SurA N-terminal domain-containing protein [Gemmatimonadota bacterium]
MRDSAKWVMLILSVAFVGWLVLDWVQSRGLAGFSQVDPVVGEVGGAEIHYNQWNRYLQAQLDAARQQRSGSLTEEEVRQVREAAWNDLVSQTLMQQEMDRLGIRVTDEEIREAFQTRPPPSLVSHPAFQTDGRFDIQKYRAFFSNPAVDENLLLQIESYYRQTLPRTKLLQRLTEGIYISDEAAWQYFRDVNETVTVRFVSVDPSAEIADDSVRITADQVAEYYRAHQEEFARPATAVVNMVSLGTRPSAADTAAALARVDSVRASILRGDRTFEDAAKEVSADSASGALGGDLGKRVKGELDPAFEKVAFSIRTGDISRPVATPFGFHLLRVDGRRADTVSVRHILIPIELSAQTEDSLFDVMDRLEGVALRADLGAAADSLGLPIRNGLVLAKGSEFVPGAGALGVAPEWALDPQTELGELSSFFRNASGYHVFELVERRAADTAPLEEVADEIRERLRSREKLERTREIMRRAREMLTEWGSLEQVARRFGWKVSTSEPFRRVDFVPGLGQGTEAIGEAFGLPVGAFSGVADAGDRVAILQVVARQEADREEFEKTKDDLRRRLTLQRRQDYLNTWLRALRETANIRDLRDEVSAAANQT